MTAQPLTSNQLEFDDTLEAIEFFLDQGWSGGLPVVPPTEERVREFLGSAGVAPSEIVATVPTRGRVITAEKAAINAVMAGCRPEYFPTVLAALEAMGEPRFNLHAITISTMGAAPLLVVNGPIAKELGMNSGVSAFGPGNRANATIGRAIGLIVTNASGAVPGSLDKAALGHPGKYSFCIAEAEDASPWEPLHVERGLSPHQSAVTVFASLSPIQVSDLSVRSPESILAGLGDVMLAAGHGQSEIVVVLCPETLDRIRSRGWSKMEFKERLFQAARRKLSEWVSAGRVSSESNAGQTHSMVGAAESPESITVIVAGGPAGDFPSIIPIWGGGSGSRSVTREIHTAVKV